MRTNDQRNASRINGAKSNGPTTDEGKASSSRNGNRHNLSSSGHIILLSTEDPALFHRLRESYVTRFQPVDGVEMDLVERLFAASWREQRIARMEAALMELEIENQREDIEEDYDEMDEETRQTLAFLGTANQRLGSALLMRYAGAARRAYASAYRILRDLQGDRFNRPPAKPVEQNRHRQEAEPPCPPAKPIERNHDQQEPDTTVEPGNFELPSEPGNVHRAEPRPDQTGFAVCKDHTGLVSHAIR